MHCKRGIRGEMAYSLLKEKGYGVKFLRGVCVCTPDGNTKSGKNSERCIYILLKTN